MLHATGKPKLRGRFNQFWHAASGLVIMAVDGGGSYNEPLLNRTNLGEDFMSLQAIPRVVFFCLPLLTLGAWIELAAADERKNDTRVFEMRTYICEEGRLDALNKRFREHTNRLFVKHGITLIGYWTPMEGDEAKNTLIYILAFPSREARDASFKAFGADPDWKKARDESEKDGKIVKQVISKFLTPTDYSPIK